MAAVLSAARRVEDRDAALKSLYADVAHKNMFPFWATSTDVVHDEIKQLMGTARAVPFLWSCADDIEPILHRAVELITMDDSERRSLILVNPGLAPKRASVSTMYTAYRLNDANEIMPPHRHSPNAIRLGLTGSMNFTGVEGENITFGPGDMVLTPHDTWHNHGNQGDDERGEGPVQRRDPNDSPHHEFNRTHSPGRGHGEDEAGDDEENVQPGNKPGSH